MEKEMEDYYIAYIDILNTKELMNNVSFLHKLKKAYESCRNIGGAFYKNVTIKVFSDNISLVTRIDENVDGFVKYVSYMLQYFLRLGFMPRGGICKGRLYIDDVFLLGQALVDAYCMESIKAIYPRIIVSEDVADSVSNHVKSELIFVDDIDNEYYLNLFAPFGVDSDKIKKELLTVREWFDKKYDEVKRDVKNKEYNKLMQKYFWFDNYLKMVDKKYCSVGNNN